MKKKLKSTANLYINMSTTETIEINKKGWYIKL